MCKNHTVKFLFKKITLALRSLVDLTTVCVCVAIESLQSGPSSHGRLLPCGRDPYICDVAGQEVELQKVTSLAYFIRIIFQEVLGHVENSC